MVLSNMIIIIGIQSVLVSLLKVNQYSIEKHVMLDMTAGYYKLKHCVTFILLEIGDGWGPLVLNSEEELDFVRRGSEFQAPTIQSYWIGGSTDANKSSTIEYSEYYTNMSGNRSHYSPIHPTLDIMLNITAG